MRLTRSGFELGHAEHPRTGRQPRSDGRAYPLASPQPYPEQVRPPTVPWQPLGNMRHGDCVFAALAHSIQASDPAIRFTTAQVLDPYLTYCQRYDNGADNGSDPSIVEDEAMTSGLFGWTCPGFTGVDHTSEAALKSAISTYRSVLVEIEVTRGVIADWERSAPWTLRGSRAFYGLHEIALVGYQRSWLYGVSWGTLVAVAPRYLATFGLQAQSPLAWRAV